MIREFMIFIIVIKMPMDVGFMIQKREKNIKQAMSTLANLEGQQVDVKGDTINVDGNHIEIGTHADTTSEINIGNPSAFLSLTGQINWINKTDGVVALNGTNTITNLHYSFTEQQGIQRIRVSGFQLTALATQAQVIQISFPHTAVGPFRVVYSDFGGDTYDLLSNLAGVQDNAGLPVAYPVTATVGNHTQTALATIQTASITSTHTITVYGMDLVWSV